MVPVTSSPSTALWNRKFNITFNILNAQPQVNPDNIIWRRSVTNTGIQTINESDRFVFSNNRRSLEITNVMLSDIGRYMLTASNNGGSSSASIIINVLGE